jgi:hypothetical protein
MKKVLYFSFAKKCVLLLYVTNSFFCVLHITITQIKWHSLLLPPNPHVRHVSWGKSKTKIDWYIDDVSPIFIPRGGRFAHALYCYKPLLVQTLSFNKTWYGTTPTCFYHSDGGGGLWYLHLLSYYYYKIYNNADEDFVGKTGVTRLYIWWCDDWLNKEVMRMRRLLGPLLTPRLVKSNRTRAAKGSVVSVLFFAFLNRWLLQVDSIIYLHLHHFAVCPC